MRQHRQSDEAEERSAVKLQTIDIDGAACAIVPLKDYDALRDALEDAADAEAMRLGRAEESVPMVMVDRLCHENPVRVWREYRQMTPAELAAAADIAIPQLATIESGDNSGSVLVLQRIAKALQVAVDDLLS